MHDYLSAYIIWCLLFSISLATMKLCREARIFSPFPLFWLLLFPLLALLLGGGTHYVWNSWLLFLLLKQETRIYYFPFLQFWVELQVHVRGILSEASPLEQQSLHLLQTSSFWLKAPPSWSSLLCLHFSKSCFVFVNLFCPGQIFIDITNNFTVCTYYCLNNINTSFRRGGFNDYL